MRVSKSPGFWPSGRSKSHTICGEDVGRRVALVSACAQVDCRQYRGQLDRRSGLNFLEKRGETWWIGCCTIGVAVRELKLPFASVRAAGPPVLSKVLRGSRGDPGGVPAGRGPAQSWRDPGGPGGPGKSLPGPGRALAPSRLGPRRPGRHRSPGRRPGAVPKPSRGRPGRPSWGVPAGGPARSRPSRRGPGDVPPESCQLAAVQGGIEGGENSEGRRRESHGRTRLGRRRTRARRRKGHGDEESTTT